MNTLGLDLSLTATGVVILKDGKLDIKQLIKTKPSAEKSHLNEIKRLLLIVDKIEQIISENLKDISLVAIEGLSFGARNTTALMQLAGLNYLVRKLLHDYNIPFVIVAPTSLKKFITGKGNSGKDVMMMETYKRYGVTLSDDNLCDAYCLARVAEAIKRDIKLTSFQKEVVNLLKKE